MGSAPSSATSSLSRPSPSLDMYSLSLHTNRPMPERDVTNGPYPATVASMKKKKKELAKLAVCRARIEP